MLSIGVICELQDDHTFKPGTEDRRNDLVSQYYLDEITTVLHRLGFSPEHLGGPNDLAREGRALVEGIDYVFSLAQGVKSRNRAAAVPMLLELLEVPYLGSDAWGHSLALNKFQVGLMAQNNNIRVPKTTVVYNQNGLCKLEWARWPTIVKPLHEGSSVGIGQSSVVNSMDELKSCTRSVIKLYDQPALVQEFISGFEITVPVIGNQKPRVVQTMQVVMDGNLEMGDRIYTSQIKEKEEHRVSHIAWSGRLGALETSCLRLFREIGLADFARFDFRVSPEGEAYLIDLNALAHLGSESSFARAYGYLGYSHADMIEEILQTSFRRWGIEPLGKQLAES